MIRNIQRACVCLLAFSCASVSRGETFSFGGSQNAINGLANAALIRGAFQMQLQVGLPGTLLNEPQAAGLGINSTAVAGADEIAPALFNTIGGSGPLAGASESLYFSFDRPGFISDLNFDGVKDESFEYFILESSGGLHVNLFDSAANITVPGHKVDAAIQDGILTGTVIYLEEHPVDDPAVDDEIRGVHIPFTAGQQFTLSFHALGPQYGPLEESNGVRLQGITVQAVPELATVWLAMIVGIAGLGGSRRMLARRGWRCWRHA